jgi:acyl-CoA synthetase (AMP-forming)/AMP-acid ligase II
MPEKPSQPSLTIREMVFFNGQDYGATAIEDLEGRKTTYGQLYDHVRNLVGMLNGAGFRRNDRIAITLPSGPEMAVAVIALTCGFTTIPLNPNQTALEYERYLQHVHARALLVEGGSGLHARKVAKDLGMEILELIKCEDGRAGIFSLAGLEGIAKGEPEFAKPEDIANILFTSGTTFKPKIVPWTHSMICWGHYYNQLNLPFLPSDRYLILNPLFHAAGLNNIYRPLYTGGTIICSPGFQRSEFFQWLDQARPTIYSAVPAVHQSIIEMAQENMDVISRSRLRLIRAGSTSLPSKTLKELEGVFGVPVVETYSSSEVIGIGRSPPCMGHRSGALKPVAPEIEIMDEKGKELHQGELGEIAVRGPNVFKGYENDPEANAAAFVDGWFRTGDLGYFDGEGYLHVAGRVTEMIDKGGEKVAPQEIDNALLEHPAVIEAVAFPVHHQTLGEDIDAVVVLKEGEQVTDGEIRSFLFDRLAYFKVPTRIIFVKEIPKGATGKANRSDMARILELL